MAKLRRNRINKIVIALVVCVVSAMMGFVLGNARVLTGKASAPLLSQQSDEKEIDRYERPGEPFEFGNLNVKRTKFNLRQKFSAKSLAQSNGGEPEDWVENLEFSLKNKLGKQITFILVQLQFPETEVNGPKMIYNLHMGIPVAASESEKKSAAPLALEPGKRAVFTLSSEELKLLKEFLAIRRFELAKLNKLIIRVVSVVFDDGMKWEMDYYYKPNSSLPGGYERMSNGPVER
jgi:hypothetical protein